jgi:hypothetical protein
MEENAKDWEDRRDDWYPPGDDWYPPEQDSGAPMHTSAECEEWAAQVVAEQRETLEGLAS